MEEGAEINCLVIRNKLSEEDGFSESEDYYSNNFLDLSLKNSLIKGLHQRSFDYFKSEEGNLNEENLQPKIILGVYSFISELKILVFWKLKNLTFYIGIKFSTKNLDLFASENLVLDDELNDPNYFENNYDINDLKAYDKYLSYKSNKVSGFSYEK